jgi:hypothetical protein
MPSRWIRLALMALSVSVTTAAAAQTPLTAEKDKEKGPKVTAEFYGTLLPFTEYVNSSGATRVGYAGKASQVPAAAYTGVNDPGRLRMTAGTSGVGFKGSLEIVENLKLIWQVENAVPIDGNGPPNTFASRNSHVGFTGDWGTIFFGIWDTPWKQALLPVSPIAGGYVADYSPIISTPGFGVGALNTAQGWAPASGSNAAFYRREVNSIQYWSPTLAGFSARLSFTINEGRNTGNAFTPRTNPYLVSGNVGWDGAGLKVRYAYEMHHDFFGMAQLGGTPWQTAAPMAGAPTPTPVKTSTDQGHQLTAIYTLKASPVLQTRFAASGEFLQYKQDDTNAGAIEQFARPAFYGLVEQAFGPHHVWGAYGMALEGSCKREGGAACSTSGLGAMFATLGYLFAFNERSNIHVIGYRVFNDVSARYVTFPALSPMAPGADTMGVGIGFIHAFKVGLLGDE